MWRHVHHRLVVGYHGCDRSLVERVVLRGESLKKSSNDWDWLGEGVYFWEHSHARALQFAEWKRGRGEIDEPTVLGAYIHLGRCFDLTDPDATKQLRGFYDDYLAACAADALPLRENRPARGMGDDLILRELDCAVLNLGLVNLDRSAGDGGYYYQSVRGVFVEGAEAYPGAAIRERTHVQIAVRDERCILGYFVPASYAEGQP
ncbi:MAG: hypothetical protein R3A52_17745 [Polyangiales bacterium]